MRPDTTKFTSLLKSNSSGGVGTWTESFLCERGKPKTHRTLVSNKDKFNERELFKERISPYRTRNIKFRGCSKNSSEVYSKIKKFAFVCTEICSGILREYLNATPHVPRR